MAEESALKPRISPSRYLNQRHAGDPARAEHLHNPPQFAGDPKNRHRSGTFVVEDGLHEWAQNVLENTPNVRSDLVRSLQIQIEAGLYSIDMDTLAERLAVHVCRPLVIEGK